MAPKTPTLRPATTRRSRPSLLYMVKQLELAVRSRLDDVLKPAGITALQYTALTVLERHDGISAAELARTSFVTPQTMADMIGSLEKRGLIRRGRNPVNRRQLILGLTEEGHQLLAAVAGPVRDLEEAMTASLGSKEVAQLRDHINECRKALTDRVSVVQLATLPA